MPGGPLSAMPLRRLGKRDVDDPPIVPAARIYDYRTKLTLHVAGTSGRIGLHRYGRPDQVFDLEWCHITVPELMELWQAVRTLRPVLPARLVQIVLRLDRSGGRHVVLRVGEGEVWSGFERLRRELERTGHPGHHLVPAGRWGRPGRGRRTEAFPATVFEQVHPEMGDQVRAFALEQLGDVSGPSGVGSLRRDRRNDRSSWCSREPPSRASSSTGGRLRRRRHGDRRPGGTPAESRTCCGSCIRPIW